MTRLALVLPRNMRFSPESATAIDLCAHDYARFSGFGASLAVFARPVDPPFADVPVAIVPRSRRRPTVRSDFADAIADFRPDAILVEQYLPEAMALARAFGNVPVLLRRHGLVKRPGNPVRRWRLARRYRRLARVVAVSRIVARSVTEAAGVPPEKVTIVENGLDTHAWRPARPKAPLIAYAGRLAPEKGVLEAARAVVAVLAEAPDWHAAFVFVDPDVHPAYREAVLSCLGEAAPGRVDIACDRPHAQVQALFERAAIVLVPALWAEPFGRTAIEAMAAGAALVTSGRGGLADIVGPPGAPPVAAIVAPEDAGAFAATLTRLLEASDERETLAAAGLARARADYDIRASAAALDRAVLEAVAASR